MKCRRLLTNAAEAVMFNGFDTSIVDVGETTIFIRRRGGQPVATAARVSSIALDVASSRTGLINRIHRSLC